MEGIDTEVLISLVQAKPVLWDKTLDIYKERIGTRKAWEEVCLALKPDFENISDTEKNAFGKEVIRRWTSLRDCFSRCKREERATKKSGSEAKKRKKYVFSDQLQFLNKVYTDANTVDSLDSEIEPGLGNTPEEDGEPGGSGTGDPSVSFTANVNLPSNNTSRQRGTRKHKKPDEIELKMLKALEPKPACSKMSFLQSLMPHLQKYTEKEFLRFQIGVLNVIETINKTQETIPNPHPNYSFSMQSYQPVSQYISQPPQTMQQQAFLNPQQPSFSPPPQNVASPASLSGESTFSDIF